MRGLFKRKGEAGEAVRYMSRNKAIRKLQLHPVEFRRLCILKGIFPREPKHRNKAQKGKPGVQILYLKKDIDFLAHEPLIWKIRQEKVHRRRLKTAKEKRDNDRVKAALRTKPELNLDHLVVERYPTFRTALRDLDDCLTMLFMFARLAADNHNHEIVQAAERLTVEFQHYIIAARCLKRVFISVKGYYYQAVIMGETVTWVVPHPFVMMKPKSMKLHLMGTFAKFYVTLLGFVNFKLYQSLNLQYPPRLTEKVSGREKQQDKLNLLASLNRDLVKRVEEPDDEAADDMYKIMGDDDKLAEAKKERLKERQQQHLFQGLKFFLGRENNMDSLAFIIRACGGEVSWDASVGAGSTYGEDDPAITHQIVDRPKAEQTHLSRYYVQPQWVYDAINARTLLPVQDYFPGVTLPAHVSPFDSSDVNYMPPEKLKMVKLLKESQKTKKERKEDARKAKKEAEKVARKEVVKDGEDVVEEEEKKEEKDDLDDFMDEESDDEAMEDEEDGGDEGEKEEEDDEKVAEEDGLEYEEVTNLKGLDEDEDEDEEDMENDYKPPEDEEEEEEEKEEEKKPAKKSAAVRKMGVKESKKLETKVDKNSEEREERRLREMKLKRKEKFMYNKLKKRELKGMWKGQNMEAKRQWLDARDKQKEEKDKMAAEQKERKNWKATDEKKEGKQGRMDQVKPKKGGNKQGANKGNTNKAKAVKNQGKVENKRGKKPANKK